MGHLKNQMQAHAEALDFEKAAYSINKGLWGTSVGGKETLQSKGILPEEAWPGCSHGHRLQSRDPPILQRHR